MKFLVDFMLGRLNQWLRILGYDCLYFRRPPSSGFQGKKDLIYLSLKDGRIILTRDKTLSRKKAIKPVIIKSDFLSEQIKQVFKELGLVLDDKKIFSRCIVCNSLLEPIDKKKVEHSVPPYVYENQEEFSICLLLRLIFVTL